MKKGAKQQLGWMWVVHNPLEGYLVFNYEDSRSAKAANKVLSQVRIFVENAIGGIKRYNILVHAFRNRRENFQDDVIAVSAALWNLSLNY